MKISWEEIELNLRHTFVTARESKKNVKRVIVKLEDDGFYGLGEAAPSPRYNESVDTVKNFLNEFNKLISENMSLYTTLQMLNNLNGNYSAKSAVDIALYDLHTKKLNLPLWQYFGLTSDKIINTSFTIGIDTTENIERKLDEAHEFKVLKIKLGCEDDIKIIQTIRRYTDKPLRIDVNEGWKNLNKAIELIKYLEDNNIELIEQPLPSEMLYENNRLREQTTIPFFADENCKTFEDLILVKDYFDGINIKLSKCGGIFNAYLMIQVARYLNLKIMLGCMIESSIGISAAAQLASMVDYIDLDGNLLINNDPYTGVICKEGELKLINEPGIGVMKIEK